MGNPPKEEGKVTPKPSWHLRRSQGKLQSSFPRPRGGDPSVQGKSLPNLIPPVSWVLVKCHIWPLPIGNMEKSSNHYHFGINESTSQAWGLVAGNCWSHQEHSPNLRTWNPSRVPSLLSNRVPATSVVSPCLGACLFGGLWGDSCVGFNVTSVVGHILMLILRFSFCFALKVHQILGVNPRNFRKHRKESRSWRSVLHLYIYIAIWFPKMIFEDAFLEFWHLSF